MNEDEEQQQQGRTIESAIQSFQSSIHKLLHRYQKHLHYVNNTTNDNNDNENDNKNGNHNECNNHGDDDDDDDESLSKDIVKKIISECKYLTLHSNHIFRMLHSKRHLLKLALNAFGTTSKDLVDMAASKAGNIGHVANVAKDMTDFIELIERILRHWFAMYIRLRDGFMLLESGER